MVKRLSDILDSILTLTVVLVSIIMCFVWLAVCAQIVTRYFLGYSMGWVIEMAQYSMLWICFLGSAWLLQRGGHISMDMLLNRLNRKNRDLINSINAIIGAILVLVVGFYGGQVTWELLQSGVHVVSLMEPLKGPIIMIIPLGSLLLFIVFLRTAYRYLQSYRGVLNEEQRP